MTIDWRRVLRAMLWMNLAALPAAWLLADFLTQRRAGEVLLQLKLAGHPLTRALLSPPPVPPEMDAAPLYLAAGRALREVPDNLLDREFDERARRLTAPEQAQLRSWLAGQGEAVDIITQARRRATCRFVPWITNVLLEAPDPTSERNGETLSRLLRWLCVGGRVAAQDGEAESALMFMDTAFQVLSALGAEQVTTARLIHLYGLRAALNSVERCVRPGMQLAQLRRWRRLIPPPEPIHGIMALPYREAMACWAERLAASAGAALLPMPRRDANLQPDGWTRDVARLLLRPVTRFDIAQYLAGTQVKWEIFSQNESSPRKWCEVFRGWNLLPAGLRPFTAKTERLFDISGDENTIRVHLVLVRAGLDCEIARASEGKYPATVDDHGLPPGWLLRYEPGKSRLVTDHRDSPGASWALMEWKLRQGP